MSMTINRYVFPAIYEFTHASGDKMPVLKKARKSLPIGSLCNEFYIQGLVGAVYVVGLSADCNYPGIYLFDNPSVSWRTSAACQFQHWNRGENIFGLQGQMSPMVLRSKNARVAGPSPKNYINISPRTTEGASVEAIVVLPHNHVNFALANCHAQVWHVIDGLEIRRTYGTVHADQVATFKP